MSNLSRCLFSLIFLTSVSFAQTKKKQTVGEVLERMSRSERGQNTSLQKSGTSLPQSQQLRKKIVPSIDFNTIKPPKTSQIMQNEEGGSRAEIERITDQQIKELFALSQRYKSSPNRGELWLRLAELYVEKAKLIEFRKQAEYDRRLQDFQSGKSKNKPSLDLRLAREYNKKAIQLYDYFVRDFPRDPKLDQAIFFLGYNNFELGNVNKSAQYYAQLSQRFPKSRYVGEANFSLADYYFENEKWTTALAYFEKVLKERSHHLYPFALYKSAWCLYRTGQGDSAIKRMESVINISRRSKNNGARLESEALRDIIIFYANFGNPNDASAYFKKLAGPNYFQYIEKLAYYYVDRGDLAGANALFKELIRDNPTAPKAFDYQYQLVMMQANVAESRVFRAEMMAWVKNYGPQSEWYRANQKNTELVKNAIDLRESTLRNYILQNHQTAQNSRSAFAQQSAAEGYSLYISEFAGASQYADMRFFYGELLFEMGQHKNAAAEYRWVVENAPQGKYVDKAAMNLLLALEKLLPSEEQIQKRVGTNIEPVPLDPTMQEFIKMAQWYVQMYPNNATNVEIEFKVGRLYYLTNNFEPAAGTFKDVVKKYPKSRQSVYSANLLLDIYNLRGDFDGLEKAGNEILSSPDFAASSAGGDVRRVIENASFKKSQNLEGEKNYLGAASGFEQFAKQYPLSPLAVTAMFNSAVNYERAGQLAKSISGYVGLINTRDTKADTFKNKSYGLLARLYFQVGQYERAAPLFASAANLNPKDPLAPNYYFNAASIFSAMGQINEAIKNYQAYERLSQGGEKNEVAWDLANLMANARQTKEALDYYSLYIRNGKDRARILESYWKMREIYLGAKNNAEASRVQNQILDYQKRHAAELKGQLSWPAAQIKFEQALAAYDAMKKINLSVDSARQQKAAQDKIAALNRLNTLLTEVVKMESPEQLVSALSILGQANLHMYESLVSAPLPNGLNEVETKQYKEGIAQLAEPFRAKGMESHKACISRAQELEAYGTYYMYSLDYVRSQDASHHYDNGERAITEIAVDWMGVLR